ncbi:unnamed protein product, partial [Heterosigma akashiwo]
MKDKKCFSSRYLMPYSIMVMTTKQRTHSTLFQSDLVQSLTVLPLKLRSFNHTLNYQLGDAVACILA